MSISYEKAREQVLRGAISYNRCILMEGRHTVESHQIARANIEKYKAELFALTGEAA